MNIWHNRTSQYPMLSWRAWKITVARRWFISWETKSDCFNLKLCSIQVESTKPSLSKQHSIYCYLRDIFQCRLKELCVLSSWAQKWKWAVVRAIGAKCLIKLVQGSLITTNCNGQRTASPGSQQYGFTPLLGGEVFPQHPSLPTTGAWIMCHVHIICGRRGSLLSKDMWGYATSVCLVQEKTLAKGSSSYYWERKMHSSNSFAFHFEHINTIESPPFKSQLALKEPML